nr:HD domain-containing protein [Thiothrix subterranea]
MDVKPYFRYWGKAKPGLDEAEAQWHLLPFHSLDVAAVASVWWDESPAIQHSFMQHGGKLSTKQMKAWVIFSLPCMTTASSTFVSSVKLRVYGRLCNQI